MPPSVPLLPVTTDAQKCIHTDTHTHTYKDTCIRTGKNDGGRRKGGGRKKGGDARVGKRGTQRVYLIHLFSSYTARIVSLYLQTYLFTVLLPYFLPYLSPSPIPLHNIPGSSNALLLIFLAAFGKFWKYHLWLLAADTVRFAVTHTHIHNTLVFIPPSLPSSFLVVAVVLLLLHRRRSER